MPQSVQFTFRPIDRWPRTETRYPTRSRFKTGYSKVLDLLDRELWHAGATRAVIQAHVGETEIRNDGLLRADARPAKAGVVVAFTGHHGPIQLPCDQFDRWQDNLYAIALALEALRQIDRYGVTQHGEQYRGWKAIEPPKDDIATAAVFIAQLAGVPPSDVAKNHVTFSLAYRAAAKKAHPDAGGSAETFVQLQHYAGVVKRHLGMTD